MTTRPRLTDEQRIIITLLSPSPKGMVARREVVALLRAWRWYRCLPHREAPTLAALVDPAAKEGRT